MADDSKSGAAGNRGRFVKGDPRINRQYGPLHKEAAAWGINAKNALAKKLSPDEWAEIIVKHCRRGSSWALQLYRDTFIESIAQKHEVSGSLSLCFKFGNGNGNDNGHAGDAEAA
jgi:hypothetical protein